MNTEIVPDRKEVFKAFLPATAVMVVLAALAVFSGFWVLRQAENDRYLSEAKSQILSQLTARRAFLEEVLNSELHRGQNLAAEFSINGDVSQHYFNLTSKFFLESSKYIKNIGLAKGLILTYVYPIKGNEAVLGMDYRKNPHQWPAVQHAITTRQTVIAGPLHLVQGGTGIISRTPIFATTKDGEVNGGAYLGILSIVLDADKILQDAKLDTIFFKHKKITVAIGVPTGSATRNIFWGNPSVFALQPVTLDVRLPYSTWKMAAIPEGGWQLKSNRIGEYQLTALILFLLLAGLLGLFNWRQSRELLLRSQVEEALKDNQRNLIRAMKDTEKANKSKSDFLANMSHEIRTPMNSIIGMTKMALETPPLNSRQKHFLTNVQVAADSLLHLLNDILDLSKIEAGELLIEEQHFDLVNTVKNCIATLEFLTLEKGIGLHWSFNPSVESLPVKGDELRLRQILVNLIGNAIKFTEKGAVTLAINHASNKNEPTALHFMIIDTGIGISQDKQESIFASFKQADSSISRKYGGTGLGLTISKHLAKLMHGHLWLTGNDTGGTTFHFTVELAPGQLKSAPKQQKTHSTIRRPLHILLVDDNPMNLELCRLVLQKHKHQVCLAANGQAALEQLTEQDFDFIIMDVQMPVMDGLTASTIIRHCERNDHVDALSIPEELKKALVRQRKGKHIPIAAMTANAMTGDRQKCLDAGMDYYLTKPLNPKQLQNVLQKGMADKDTLPDDASSDIPELQ